MKKDDVVLKPAQAIKEHCKQFCLNDTKYKCYYPKCTLRAKLPVLKRIKGWCQECALDFKPQECTGVILNNQDVYGQRHCPLHIYRMGKNPRLRHKRSPDHLRDYRFKRLETPSKSSNSNYNAKKDTR